MAGGVRSLIRNKIESLPAAMLFIAMLFAARNIPLFIIAAAPLAARGVDVRAGMALCRVGKRLQAMELLALTSILVAIFMINDRPGTRSKLCTTETPHRSNCISLGGSRRSASLLRKFQLVQHRAALSESARIHRWPLRSVSDQCLAVVRLRHHG